MTMETICTYNDTRDEVLIAYLYNDIDPAERSVFEAHLLGCGICRRELDELSIVRSELAQWTPPAGLDRALTLQRFGAPARPRPGAWKKLGEIPVWAQAAAAVLLLGVSAAVANIDVTYNSEGLSIRTGWLRPLPEPQAASREIAPVPEPAPWRADLATLERQLRTEMRSQPAQTFAGPAGVSEEAVLKRVRALIDESEQKQQRELALRIAEVDTHVQAQRFADLRNIERNLTAMKSNTGVDMMRLYNMTNELAVRVSQTR
jgi:hypothetical protein